MNNVYVPLELSVCDTLILLLATVFVIVLICSGNKLICVRGFPKIYIQLLLSDNCSDPLLWFVGIL